MNDANPRIGALVESAGFQRAVLGAIVLGSALVGLETSPTLVERHGGWLRLADRLVVAAFALEAALKMARHGRRPWRYFRDPWNVFDFAVLAVCLVPSQAPFAAVLRLARVLRALRLVSALPRLQLLVSALLRSVPSMGYVAALLLLHFYVYAVIGVFLFRGNDPAHFGDLATAFLSLFRVITLEDWTDVMYTQMYGSDVYPAEIALPGPEPVAMPVIGALYFVSFVLFGTMIMLNLFIGVIVSSMSDAQREQAAEVVERDPACLGGEFHALERDLERVRDRLRELGRRAGRAA